MCVWVDVYFFLKKKKKKKKKKKESMSNLEYSGTERHELSQSKEKTEDGRTVLAKSWERSEVTVDTMQDGGSSKSTSGVWLSWTDLKVEVDVSTGFLKKERKQIVRGSNARARPGEVMAVMGPSGAGKSTLFNALALRGQVCRKSLKSSI